MMLVAGSYKYFRYYLRDVPENASAIKMLEEMNGHKKSTDYRISYALSEDRK